MSEDVKAGIVRYVNYVVKAQQTKRMKNVFDFFTIYFEDSEFFFFPEVLFIRYRS